MTGPRDLVSFNEHRVLAESRNGDTGSRSSVRSGDDGSTVDVEGKRHLSARIGHRQSRPDHSQLVNGGRAAMYFRVVETSRVDGKTRVTVESEDSAIKLLLQFLGIASEFGYAFQYKADADLKSHDREKERIDSEPERKAHHAHVLSLWRSMKGMKPTEKVHRIQETMKLQGRDYRCSDVQAIVSVAIQDERRQKACSEGATGSTVVQRNGSNARVPTRVPSPQPDHRVRLVSAQGVRAHRREAGPTETRCWLRCDI